ncbi:Peptidase C1-like family [seawater metagenome]|uniref:Peptidase C1-like family n=1 Tax=seawater metagenome TaxID=1561972 RepID=A0A5E8CLN3_9ZZZZ
MKSVIIILQLDSTLIPESDNYICINASNKEFINNPDFYLMFIDNFRSQKLPENIKNKLLLITDSDKFQAKYVKDAKEVYKILPIDELKNLKQKEHKLNILYHDSVNLIPIQDDFSNLNLFYFLKRQLLYTDCKKIARVLKNRNLQNLMLSNVVENFTSRVLVYLKEKLEKNECFIKITLYNKVSMSVPITFYKKDLYYLNLTNPIVLIPGLVFQINDSKEGIIIECDKIIPSNISLPLLESWGQNRIIGYEKNIYSTSPSYYNIDISIKPLPPIYDQQDTNWCWIIATTNMLNNYLYNKTKKKIQLSTKYIFFWHILEKTNVIFENTIKSNNQMKVFTKNFGDMGIFSYVVNIINKYGIVEELQYPSTISKYNDFFYKLHQKIKECTLLIIKENKEKCVTEIYNFLKEELEEPPNSNNELSKALKDINCFKNVVVNSNSRLSKKENLIKTLRNMDEIENVKYYDKKIKQIRKACIRSLKENQSIFCSLNTNYYFDREHGIADDIIKPELLNIEIEKIKSNHSVLIVGYSQENKWWKVQNSYGEKKGIHGYVYLSDSWFRKYIQSFVILDKYLDIKGKN